MLFLSVPMFYGQVAIGKNSVSNASVSLEFGSDNRGIVLPWVNSSAAVSTAVDGTLIYDVSDKKVKYKKGGTWFDLSINSDGQVNTALQNSLTEISTAQTIIGNNGKPNIVPGILVLSDTNKAMVLPKVVSPHLNIANPAAGMVAFDTNTKQLAVFNGTNWSFWKP